jgi:hypothetical protein
MTELLKQKMEDLNKTKTDDSKKGDSTNPASSKSNIDKSGSLVPNKRIPRKTVSKGKKVSFNKNLVDTVVVESYKKYNIDMSYDESSKPETTKCKCLVF